MAKVAFIDGLFYRPGWRLIKTQQLAAVLRAWKLFLLNSWPDRGSHSVGLTALHRLRLHLLGLGAETCWAARETRGR